MPRKRKKSNASVRTATLLREVERLEALEERSPEDDKWLADLVEEIDSRIENEIGER